MNEYLLSKDLNIQLFCLFQVSQIVEYLFSIADDGSEFDPLLFDRLVDLLITSENLNIKYECSQCLCTLTQLSDLYCDRIISNFLNKLYLLIFDTENIISNNIMNIFLNILESNQESKEQVLIKLPDFFENIINKPINKSFGSIENQPNFIMITIVSILRSLIYNLEFEELQVNYLYPLNKY